MASQSTASINNTQNGMLQTYSDLCSALCPRISKHFINVWMKLPCALLLSPIYRRETQGTERSSNLTAALPA